MVNGKNEPMLQALYKEKTGKPALTKDGKQAKAYMDFKRGNFKTMGNTVMKFFGQCEPKIVAGELKAYDCYKDSKEKTIAQGSLYIPPSTRIRTKEK